MTNTRRGSAGAVKERLPKRDSAPKVSCLGASGTRLRLSYRRIWCAIEYYGKIIITVFDRP